MQVLFHSPVLCGTTKKHEFSDAVYYTTPSGAGVFSTPPSGPGVFSSGTQGWVCGLAPACLDSHGNPRVAQALTAVTTRLLQQFATGTAGTAHPAADNLARLGINNTGGAPASTLPPDQPRPR